MIIKINDSVSWNTEDVVNEEARAWIAENVMQGEPTTVDDFGRPSQWLYESDSAVVKVTREYVNPLSGSWAKKCDVVTVEAK